jgi:hypothetical protein
MISILNMQFAAREKFISSCGSHNFLLRHFTATLSRSVLVSDPDTRRSCAQCNPLELCWKYMQHMINLPRLRVLPVECIYISLKQH